MYREEPPVLYECNSNSSRTDRKQALRGNKLTINISGIRYETYEDTLNRFPETLLGCKERRDTFYDSDLDEFFFDRNRICFESILAYYQTFGVFIRPPMIPSRVLVSDIKFFDLGDDALSQVGYEKSDTDKQATVEEFLPKNKLQKKIWDLFEHPETSNAAKVVAIVSVFIIVISIILFCVETLPQFQNNHLQQGKDNANATNIYTQTSRNSDEKRSFYMIEAACISWFSFEYLIRFMCSPNKWKFFISVLNVIDLVAIIPFFITLSMQDQDQTGNVSSLAILRCIRLVRVFRIFKLSRYSRGLQILGQTFKASLRELGLLLFFLIVGVILFSSAVYYAEIGNTDSGNDFESIPHSFWWAIITMTTVGYGDMAPKTLGGKLVGCMCAITGVLAIALPVPVIVSNFAFYYSKEQNKGNETDSPRPADTDYDIDGTGRGFAGMNCLGNVGVRNIKRRRKKKQRKKSNALRIEQDMDQTYEGGSRGSGKIGHVADVDETHVVDLDENVNERNAEVQRNERSDRTKRFGAHRVVVANGVEPTTPNRETVV